MASAPSVETVLTKITRHNPDVIGCIAATDDDIYSNLPEAYELVDSEAMVDHATNVFKVTDGLDNSHDGFDELFLEYERHSFYARRLDDAVLILVNSPIRRSAFRKMKIGVNLFLQPLERALRNPDGKRTRDTRDGEPLGRLRRVFGSLV